MRTAWTAPVPRVLTASTLAAALAWAALAGAALAGAPVSAQEPAAGPAAPASALPPVPSAAPAAQAAGPRIPRPNMQAMNEALGVTCAYCHVPHARFKDELDFKSEANPKKRVARMMVAMTADINAAIPAAVLKASAEATTVTCLTCHRGVADPRPLPEILTHAIEDEGLDDALARYRALRARYFGKDAYDFSQATLLAVAQKMVERDPEGALSLMRVNLEFYPASADSYVMMAVAETRRLDDRAAIVHLEKALAIDPRHSLALGYLEQLKQFTKRRP